MAELPFFYWNAAYRHVPFPGLPRRKTSFKVFYSSWLGGKTSRGVPILDGLEAKPHARFPILGGLEAKPHTRFSILEHSDAKPHMRFYTLFY